ncbi:FecR family protein [Sphingobacterium multivorum]|uniref:FecR family protein n=1 Tax=Sphingobacterium multivorum TaxID=28454 RepID=UPI0031BAC3DF
MYNYQRLKELFEKFLSGNLNALEQHELDHWYAQSEDKTFFEENPQYQQGDIREKLLGNIHKELGIGAGQPSLSRIRGRIIHYGIAASLLVFFLTGLAVYHWYGKIRADDQHQIAAETVMPARDQALIRLADGQVVDLDRLKPGTILRVGNYNVIKNQDGQVEYVAANSNSCQAVMNQVETPKGGTINLKLPDGTEVTLNAGSTLRFSQDLVSQEIRKVELVGEGLFHVAKLMENGHKKRFIVHTVEQDVEVLGTIFNVQAYAGEMLTKTALVEGSVVVKCQRGARTVKLKPGFQAIWDSNKKAFDVEPFDNTTQLDWIHGDFVFENESLKTVLDKVSRWYNVEIKYEKSYPDVTFYGSVSRKNSLADVLELLKKTSNITFRVTMNSQGEKILIVE